MTPFHSIYALQAIEKPLLVYPSFTALCHVIKDQFLNRSFEYMTALLAQEMGNTVYSVAQEDQPGEICKLLLDETSYEITRH